MNIGTLEIGKVYFEPDFHLQSGNSVRECEYKGKVDGNWYQFSNGQMREENLVSLYENEIEAQKAYDNFHQSVSDNMRDQIGIVNYMLDKIKEFCRSDVYGYGFTPKEYQIFKQRLNEEFGIEADLEFYENKVSIKD
ncbi:hypothetical protein [Brevibacillus brevis]|uniref:hypothetical protein n=1 Tax=Brevibacillus brevis TaxID=1393 RepID=UPI0007D8A32D|nr:hypothetical protein [Brevibacillus brevis]